MPKGIRVGIVGCGVAGAACALLLQRSGHLVTLFERAPKVGPVGAGILLQPSGQGVLKRMGLLEVITAKAEPIHHLFARTHRGRQLVNLPYGEVFPGCLGYGLHRGDLFAVLHRELIASSVELRLGSEILQRQDERLRGFDLVVAADGARSALRQNCELTKSVYEYPHAAVWAVGNCSAISRRLFQVSQGTRHLVGLLPMGESRCSLFWSLPVAEKDAFVASSFGRWRDQVLKLCPEAAEIFETVQCHDDLRITGYWHVRMPSWHAGNFVLIGDAAHAMSPHLGQGVNLALLDAECLSNCINSCSGLPEALHSYQTARQRQIRYYSQITRLLSPFFQSQGHLLGVGRDLCLPILPHLPVIRRHMLQTMCGLKTGYLA